jgi:hypothetical protein
MLLSLCINMLYLWQVTFIYILLCFFLLWQQVNKNKLIAFALDIDSVETTKYIIIIIIIIIILIARETNSVSTVHALGRVAQSV